MPEATDPIQQALRTHFRHEGFRAGQREPVEAVLSGLDAVVVMPTGSGKSLCYQLSAMMLPGTTLVVSPLIALMKDQVDALDRLGIPATFLNSSLGLAEMDARLARFEQGAYKLVYIAPERLRNDRFLDALEHVQVPLLAIDEAHCISQWGHDFRPDYLALGELVRALGADVRVMAVTATATPAVREDIVRQLGLGAGSRTAPFTSVQGFARPNLHLSVVHCRTHEEKLFRVAQLAGRHGTGIVYCATRKMAQTVYERLCSDSELRGKVQILLYTGALGDADRSRAQEAFLAAKNPVVVATNAFGMGIDRADIRFVAHWDVPGSIEAYYQEVGRAGRDGAPSWCELLFNYADVRTQRFFLDGANPDKADARRVLELIRATCRNGPQSLTMEEWAADAELKNPMAVRTIFGILDRAGYIRRVPVQGGGREAYATELVKPDPGMGPFNEAFRERSRKREHDEGRLQAMIRFVDTRECRQAFILDYFGEEPHEGICDGCDNDGPAEPSPPLSEEQWILVQKVLSCVARMQGRYGAKRIVEVLRGVRSDEVLSGGLESLSTFGLAADFRAPFLSQLLDALARARCVEVSDDEYRLFSITPLGLRVVRREIPDFSFPWPGSVAATKKKAVPKTVDATVSKPKRVWKGDDSFVVTTKNGRRVPVWVLRKYYGK